MGVCSVEGCNKSSHVRGWCWAHYLRWYKHGNPLSGGTAKKEPMRFFREVVLRHGGDECLVWPFVRGGRGYGQFFYEGKMQYVHRVLCREVHGPSPTPKHEAAHACGNGHKGCVNPKHVSWKTSAENKADMIVHGTRCSGERNGHAKLTKSDVHQIRALRGVRTQEEIGKLFGVDQSHVCDIQLGNRWRDIGAENSRNRQTHCRRLPPAGRRQKGQRTCHRPSSPSTTGDRAAPRTASAPRGTDRADQPTPTRAARASTKAAQRLTPTAAHPPPNRTRRRTDGMAAYQHCSHGRVRGQCRWPLVSTQRIGMAGAATNRVAVLAG